MASVTRFRLRTRPLIALVTLAACSPDLTLLNDGMSFAGVDAGGNSASSAGDRGDGGKSSTHAGESSAGESSSRSPSAGEGGAAGMLGVGGQTNEAGAPSECTPSIEVCNGEDDDCNSVVDEGCPSGVTTTFEGDLKALGDSPGGAAFADDCKHGQVLGGVKVRMGAFLAQIQGVCRTAQLKLEPASTLGYTLSLKAEAALAAHPTDGQDTATTLSCPTNEALVGLRISQQHATLPDETTPTVIPMIWLSCAKLILVQQRDELGVTWTGLKELAPASGSIANGTAWFASALATEGLVATRLHGAAGTWIDRVGLGVSRVEVVR
jgi:hypothetical protein